jgi:predicted N-acetyltransferase YhbS
MAAVIQEEVLIVPATLEDAQLIFDVINDAYKVESGSSDVAFKNCSRFENIQEVVDLLKETTIVKAVDISSGDVIGCISYYMKETSSADKISEPRQKWLYFGPLAVLGSVQGKGVGRQLIAHVFQTAIDNGAMGTEIRVVNIRNDIIPMYLRLGFEQVGTEDYPVPRKLTKLIHFLVMRRVNNALVRSISPAFSLSPYNNTKLTSTVSSEMGDGTS